MLLAISILALYIFPAAASAVTDHPRLWFRIEDIPRLRSWANDSNPVYKDGLSVLAANAKADMDNNLVPGSDSGGGGNGETYPTEMYAELFAFMSLIENNQSVREDYAKRARTLLMYIMNNASQGPEPDRPFRDPAFSISDRASAWGEGFPLTVDWIYPYLNDSDKATIRQVFLRWVKENMNASTTEYNHPEPHNVINDPVLISDRTRVRWSLNNYYQAHMRNIGLMTISMDESDDPGNELRNYLDYATGAWLYVNDYARRTDGRGGLSPEGWLYGTSLGMTAQFLLALHTAGQDDPVTRGQQVVLSTNPFWKNMIQAYLHSLSPSSLTYPEFSWIGEVYQPPWYGDGMRFWMPDFIQTFGPLGLYSNYTGNTTDLNALRWIEINTSPGRAEKFMQRINYDSRWYGFTNAIFYFLLFDPASPPPADPRSGEPLNFYAPGIGRILARTGWDANASYFSYLLGWTTIDHQQATGNQFEFYRKGEWLTRSMAGYDGATQLCYIGTSDYHNNLALENNLTSPDFRQYNCVLKGSQYVGGDQAARGDGIIMAHSFGNGYTYVLGNATELYNTRSDT